MVIEPLHRQFDLLLVNYDEVPFLRRLLANETIGVLIRDSLPGQVGLNKGNPGLKMCSNAFVVGKILAFLRCDRIRIEIAQTPASNHDTWSPVDTPYVL